MAKKTVKKTNSKQSVNKKSPSAQKKAPVQKPVREPMDPQVKRTLWALFLIALSVVFALSMFGIMGSIGALLSKMLLGVFGVGAYVVPLFVLFRAATLWASAKKSSRIILSASAATYILTSVWTVIKVPEDVLLLSFKESVSSLYESGAELISGGVLSIPSVYLARGMGRVGAAVILVFLFLALAVVVTGVTYAKFAAVRKNLQDALAERRVSPEREDKLPPPPPTFTVPEVKKYDVPSEEEVFSSEPVTDDEIKEVMERFDPEMPSAISVDAPKKDRSLSVDLITGTPTDEKDLIVNSDTQKVLFDVVRDAGRIADSPIEDTASEEVFIEEEPVPVEDIPESVPELTEDETAPFYRYPELSLLIPGNSSVAGVTAEMKETGEKLLSTLSSFSVDVKLVGITPGPSVTRYELQPSPGVKISRITNLSDDIALNLATSAGVRMEAPIPGKAAIGVEIPNKHVSTVRLREILSSNDFITSQRKLTVALGRDIEGRCVVADLSDMPHLLIAGATGSGKSVCINTFLLSLLYKATPDEVKLILVDPKVVELGIYNGISHLLVPVVTDAKKAAGALNWAVSEMLNRYRMFAERNVRDYDSYNASLSEGEARIPQIVIVIDELSDLMMAAPAEVEDAICRLAQMARAAGMVLVLATQRPSADIITGKIKSNIPSRIAFAVSSHIDSKIILDHGGAEKLVGKGDMLYSHRSGGKEVRIQGCYVSDGEVEKVINFLKNSGSAEYSQDIMDQMIQAIPTGKNDKSVDPIDDEMGGDEDVISAATDVIVEYGRASTSLLQSKLKVGYAKASRILDELEDRGIVGPHQGSKPREVLITKYQLQEMKMRKMQREE